MKRRGRGCEVVKKEREREKQIGKTRETKEVRRRMRGGVKEDWGKRKMKKLETKDWKEDGRRQE